MREGEEEKEGDGEVGEMKGEIRGKGGEVRR